MSRGARWTQEQYDAHIAKRGTQAPEPHAKQEKNDRYRSKTEREYATMLVILRRAGEIENWMHEPFSMRIANDVRYTPDFLVITLGGKMELHEVKGPYARRVGINKFKVARDMYPWFTWKWCQKIDGEWRIT